MRVIKIIVISLIILVPGFYGYFKINNFFSIDSCLDKGGKWNYSQKRCEFCDSMNYLDSTIVDSRYSKGTWSRYFQTIKTTQGMIVKLRILNDSCFVIQWGDTLRLKTYLDTFHLEGNETRIPKFVTANKDYIVMRQGCGNPCWIGYFLPRNDSLKPYAIHEYLDFDLDNDLVARINSSNSIEILNMKSTLKEQHKLDKCSSVFPEYCIESLTIKGKTLKYKWIPKTKINSKEGSIKIERIKI